MRVRSEAFVADSADIASRVASLAENVPRQIARGKSSIKVGSYPRTAMHSDSAHDALETIHWTFHTPH
jgi:hypothetical protein